MRSALLIAKFLLPCAVLAAPVATTALLSASGKAALTPVSEAQLAALAPASGGAESNLTPQFNLLEDVVLAKMSFTNTMDQEVRCLAQAVYFEARSEPLEGQLAVAQVVLNRVSDPRYPDSICGVVFQNEHRKFSCQFSFACDGLSDNPYNPQAWRVAGAVANIALDNAWHDITDTATHYHAVYVAPYWRDYLHPTVQFGDHLFYRDRS